MVLEKILESPLDSKEVKSVNPKGNQPWMFIGRTDAEASILWSPEAKSSLIGKTDAEAEAPILWPPDEKSGLTGKDPDAGED